MNEKLEKAISQDSRVCSSMYRFAYNRFKDDIVASQVYRILAKTFEDVNCHLRNSAMRKANGLFTLTKNKDE